MTQPSVSIIIINWQLKEMTLRCLRSLEGLEPPCRVVVVDNGSADGSVEYLSAHWPQLEILASPTNLGFGRACNLAIRHVLNDTSTEYVLILNNDAIIESQTIAALLAAAQEHREAGVFGPKIYYHDAPDTFWCAGAQRRRGVLAAKATGRGEQDAGQFDQRGDVDYIFGAAMLIRREVFERVGMFDEQFFLYLEDLDLCLRVQQAGFRLRLVPAARIWHSVSASTRQHLGMRRYYMVQSTLLFLRKHTTPLTILPILLFWPLVALRFLLDDLRMGHWELPRYLVGLRDGLTRQPQNVQRGTYEENPTIHPTMD